MNADAPIEPVDEIWDSVRGNVQAIVVDSPPGAGKSTLVREISRRAANSGMVPVIVQTNAQADDQIAGYLGDMDRSGNALHVGRLHAVDFTPPAGLASDSRVTYSSTLDHLRNANVIIATGAKWSTISGAEFDFGIIDEAYQMRSDALQPIGRMIHRLLMVGDPGQLAPYTEANEELLRGFPLSPLDNAAATVLKTNEARRFALPTSYRLDGRAAPVISSAFYERPFTAVTATGVRTIEFGAVTMQTAEQSAVTIAAEKGWAYLELPQMNMPEADPGVVATISRLLGVLLVTGATVTDEFGTRPLDPTDIAIGVSHHSQEFAVKDAVRAVCTQLGVNPELITVATANTLQGREFAVVIAWHPMSGRQEATPFHVDAGRLCVLLSRHRHACIVVGRAGIRADLEAQLSLGPVWLNEPQPRVDAWEAQNSVLRWLDGVRVDAA
jgi:AAA domain